jgi:transposase
MMDTLSPHKAGCLRNAVEAAGVAYRYVPPYSPDLNPIEPAWAVVKVKLTRFGGRCVA